MSGGLHGVAPDGRSLKQRIRITADGTVRAMSGKVECGQGIRTAMAQLVADELDVPFERVEVVLGETSLVPWDIGTYGSMSLAVEGRILQRAAAHARALLVERAGRWLDVEPAQLETGDGMVRSRRDGAPSPTRSSWQERRWSALSRTRWCARRRRRGADRPRDAARRGARPRHRTRALRRRRAAARHVARPGAAPAHARRRAARARRWRRARHARRHRRRA